MPTVWGGQKIAPESVFWTDKVEKDISGRGNKGIRERLIGDLHGVLGAWSQGHTLGKCSQRSGRGLLSPDYEEHLCDIQRHLNPLLQHISQSCTCSPLRQCFFIEKPVSCLSLSIQSLAGAVIQQIFVEWKSEWMSKRIALSTWQYILWLQGYGVRGHQEWGNRWQWNYVAKV